MTADLALDTDIPHVRAGDMIMAPLRRSTVEALREHMAGKRTDGPLFPGNRSSLARRLARGLQRASRNAGIGKRVYPHVFRRMRTRAFVEAGVGEDVVMNALNWTRKFGLVRRRGDRLRGPWGTWPGCWRGMDRWRSGWWSG